MGMTIEKIIETFDYIKHVGNGESEYKHCREEIALDEAVAIMRKYQKIQEILEKSSYKRGGKSYSYLYDEGTRVKHIRKVVEDGNNRA